MSILITEIQKMNGNKYEPLTIENQVKNMSELEEFRKYLKQKYSCDIYFKYKSK